MQINNWSDLLKSKRLAKTPRDLNNDLVIIGTNTVGNLKKQDTWQPYAMTLADLATAIGGGGGGVSFELQGSAFIDLYENNVLQSGAFSPAENSTIRIQAQSIPNSLNWRGEWSDTTADYVLNDVVYYTALDGTYYTYWMKNTGGSPVPVGYDLPINDAPPAASNLYWAQLGIEGPNGENGYRTTVLEMFKWSATEPATFPSGDSTYTWATGVWTDPTTTNGWNQIIPAPVPGQFLWRVKQLFTDNLTTTDSTISWSATDSDAITYAGQDGAPTVVSFSALRTTSYSLAAGTKGTMELISTSSGSNVVITIPSMNNTDMPIGAQVLFSWDAIDGGLLTTVSFLAGTNSTIKVPDGMLYLRSLYSTACLTKQSYDGTNTVWYLTGDLTNVF